jgi:hypothetical protein
MHKAFDWKRSMISMLEVEAIPQSCSEIAPYEITSIYNPPEDAP